MTVPSRKYEFHTVSMKNCMDNRLLGMRVRPPETSCQIVLGLPARADASTPVLSVGSICARPWVEMDEPPTRMLKGWVTLVSTLVSPFPVSLPEPPSPRAMKVV